MGKLPPDICDMCGSEDLTFSKLKGLGGVLLYKAKCNRCSRNRMVNHCYEIYLLVKNQPWTKSKKLLAYEKKLKETV